MRVELLGSTNNPLNSLSVNLNEELDIKDNSKDQKVMLFQNYPLIR